MALAVAALATLVLYNSSDELLTAADTLASVSASWNAQHVEGRYRGEPPAGLRFGWPTVSRQLTHRDVRRGSGSDQVADPAADLGVPVGVQLRERAIADEPGPG